MSGSKPFLTIEEQIELLRSRGMIVNPHDDLILMREGYYAIVNGYKDPFLDREASSAAGDDRYKPGTSLQSLYMLFNIDRQLKHAAFPVLVKAETTFRTALAYSFSKAFREPDAYLDKKHYCAQSQYHVPGKYHADINDLLRKLEDAHNDTEHPLIAHYIDNYGSVPLWVLVNVLTFGNISHMYALCQNGVKNAVAKNISKVQGGVRVRMEDLRKKVSTLVDFRNVCAHDDRLYCARKGKSHDKRYADMIDALILLAPASDVTKLQMQSADIINEMRFMRDTQNTILNEMGMTVSNEMLIPLSQ